MKVQACAVDGGGGGKDRAFDGTNSEKIRSPDGGRRDVSSSSQDSRVRRGEYRRNVTDPSSPSVSTQRRRRERKVPALNERVSAARSAAQKTVWLQHGRRPA